MNEIDRQRDLRLLAEVRGAMLEAVRGVSGEWAMWRPVAHCWRVVECIFQVCPRSR